MTSVKDSSRTAFLSYAKLDAPLVHRKLCSMVSRMTDAREWFSSASGRRITATEIAKHLGVSRNTVNARMSDGLNSDDIIAIARAVGVRPIDALIELGKLTYDEVYAFLEDGGKLVETASEGDLALELARRLNSARDAQNWWAVHDKVQALNNRADSQQEDDNVHPLTSRNQPAGLDPDGMKPWSDDMEILAARRVPDDMTSMRPKIKYADEFPDEDGPEGGA